MVSSQEMTIARYINLACWLAFIAYWVATARNVKRTKEVKSGLGYMRWIVFIVAFLLLRPNARASHFGAVMLLPHSEILIIIGVFLSITGVAVAIIARRRLAGNWSSGVVLKEDH